MHNMRVIYDSETDTLSLILSEEEVADSDELREGVIIDYNEKGSVVSIEILDASQSSIDPTVITYEMKEKSA